MIARLIKFSICTDLMASGHPAKAQKVYFNSDYEILSEYTSCLLHIHYKCLYSVAFCI